jgi:hypothetical protein
VRIGKVRLGWVGMGCVGLLPVDEKSLIFSEMFPKYSGVMFNSSPLFAEYQSPVQSDGYRNDSAIFKTKITKVVLKNYYFV